jgi:hypothetical protein
MALKDLHIASTDKSPDIFLHADGMLRIKGRGLAINRTELTDKVLDWIDTYLENPAEITYVIFAFEYLNSFSTTIFVMILKRLSQVLLKSKKLKISWYYEEDDEDIVERGEYISSALHIPIDFIVSKRESEI